MSDVFYLRPMAPPLSLEGALQMARDAGSCFNLHRVDWIQSYLAADGGRMLCWYRAPDAESVRIALRQLGADMSAVWPGTQAGDEAGAVSAPGDYVVVEYALDNASSQEGLRAVRERLTDGLDSCGLALERALTSTDGRRMVCLVRNSDATSVAEAIDCDDDPNPVAIWQSRVVLPPSPAA